MLYFQEHSIIWVQGNARHQFTLFVLRYKVVYDEKENSGWFPSGPEFARLSPHELVGMNYFFQNIIVQKRIDCCQVDIFFPL